MEEAEKRVLSQFRSRLANEIVVTTSFLSAFCDRSVLDEEMTKIVKSEDTYVAKAHKLLELLPKRGPKAFSTLMEILGITNPWLAEKMKSALHEERNREAKIKITSSVSESASIEGYGASSSRQTIDNDIRATAHRFVKSSLQHLTDSEQRSTEQWLGEELQRERRKQQFRIPNTIRRHPQEFQSHKETQTEMKSIELQELCEDLMVQLHGVQYTEVNIDISFKTLQKQISELMSRVHKMDFIFIECLEKFDDVDKYARSLPDLIERSMIRQKELVRALMEDRRKIQRLTEERDNLDRHVMKMEEELERLLKQRSQRVVHPHQMYLRKRKELAEKYTLIKQQEKPRTATSSASPHRSHGGSSDTHAGGHRSSHAHSDGHSPRHGHHGHHTERSEAKDDHHHGKSHTEDRQHVKFLTEEDIARSVAEDQNEESHQYADDNHVNGTEDRAGESHTDDSVEAEAKPAASTPKHRVRFSTPTSRPTTGAARRRPGTSTQSSRPGSRVTSGRLSFTNARK